MSESGVEAAQEGLQEVIAELAGLADGAQTKPTASNISKYLASPFVMPEDPVNLLPLTDVLRSIVRLDPGA
jgi:hypothetical protein